MYLHIMVFPKPFKLLQSIRCVLVSFFPFVTIYLRIKELSFQYNKLTSFQTSPVFVQTKSV